MMKMNRRIHHIVSLAMIVTLLVPSNVYAARENAELQESIRMVSLQTESAVNRQIEKQVETQIAKDDSRVNEEKAKNECVEIDLREQIVTYALSLVGVTRYVYGGNNLKTGVDCSGFVQQVYKHFDISLPRTSGAQSTCGRKILQSEMRPGDLIYYGGHIAIYIGGGKVVHASNARTGVKVSPWNYRSVRCIRSVIEEG